MSRKKYYVTGVDELHQLVETPASKERTEKNRFVITLVISVIAALTSIVAAVFSVLSYFQ